MNRIELTVERGKKILRDENINFSMFKALLPNFLHHTNRLDEDDWVSYYNSYAGCVGAANRYELVGDWAKEWFQDYNKDDHRIWLK